MRSRADALYAWLFVVLAALGFYLDGAPPLVRAALGLAASLFLGLCAFELLRSAAPSTR